MRIRDWDPNLKVRLFGEALMNITFWMFFPFLTIYFAEEFGKSMAGFLLILSQGLSVFANLMGGYCADRFGRKRMMVLSAFGQGVCFILFGLADSPWFQSPWIGFLCFSFVGFFGSIYWPASQAMVADVVEEEHRSTVFAVFYTSINIAVVIGPILGAIFYVDYRFELLLIAGIICVGLALLLQKATRETVPANTSATKQDSDKWYSFLVNQFRDYKVIVNDRIFLLFIIGGVLAAQTFMQLDLLIPVYTKEVVENQSLFSIGPWSPTISGEQAFGLILAENGFLVALLTVVVTKWVMRFKERSVFIASSLLYAIAIIGFGQTNWVWGLILAMAIFTLGELLTAGLQQNFISKIAPEQMRGQYFAAASLRYTIGRTIAPITIPMTVWFGYQWTFLIIALLAAVSAFIYWWMFKMMDAKPSLQQKGTA